MPRHRVSDINAPELEIVDSNVNIGEALERMFQTGQRQLGVKNNGTLTGVVSHRDITRVLQLSTQMDQAGAVLEKSIMMAVNRSFTQVSSEDGLFRLFDELAEAPYVVIDDGDSNRILRDVGLHQFLKEEIKEFLIIEEIERTVRTMINETMDQNLKSQLAKTFEPLEVRTPEHLEKCNFRHYAIFISNHWETFEPVFDHKQDFVRELLDRVGDIRNQMFHFRETERESTLDTDFIEFAREHLAYIHTKMMNDN